MNPRKWIKNRGIQRERIQTRERKYKISKANYIKKTSNNERKNRRNLLNYKTKLKRCSRDRLNKSDKMRNEQYRNHETLRLTKKIRTSIPVKRNKTLVKKKRSELCHNFKRIGTKIIISDIYETRKTIVHKELSRRFTS